MVRETVFVVDDDEAVRDSTAMLLAAGGFTVQTFATGAELLTACNGHGMGCALIDIHMPGMDGFAVVEALRARNAAVPVILITGLRDATIEGRARELGVVPVLEKPLGRGLLIEVVRAALSPENEAKGLPLRDAPELTRGAIAPFNGGAHRLCVMVTPQS